MRPPSPWSPAPPAGSARRPCGRWPRRDSRRSPPRGGSSAARSSPPRSAAGPLRLDVTDPDSVAELAASDRTARRRRPQRRRRARARAGRRGRRGALARRCTSPTSSASCGSPRPAAGVLERSGDGARSSSSARSPASRSTRAAAATPPPSTRSTRSPRTLRLELLGGPIARHRGRAGHGRDRVLAGPLRRRRRARRGRLRGPRAAERRRRRRRRSPSASPGRPTSTSTTWRSSRRAQATAKIAHRSIARSREPRGRLTLRPDANRRDPRQQDGRSSRSSSSRRRPRRRREQLFETARSLRELRARLRLGHLRRRRLDPRRARSRSPSALKDELGLETMAHLSCVGETREGLAATLDRIAGAGIENVLALRGDPPRGRGGLRPARGRPRQRRRAGRLHLRAAATSRSAAPASPRSTPRRPTSTTDLAYLKTKVDAGAQLPDHPALLRQPGLLRLRRRRPREGDRRADPRRRHPGRQLRPDEADLRALRRLDPAAPRGGIRGAGRRRGGRVRARRRLRRPAVRRAAARRARRASTSTRSTGRPATRAVLGALRASRPWERAERIRDRPNAVAD